MPSDGQFTNVNNEKQLKINQFAKQCCVDKTFFLFTERKNCPFKIAKSFKFFRSCLFQKSFFYFKVKLVVDVKEWCEVKKKCSHA